MLLSVSGGIQEVEYHFQNVRNLYKKSLSLNIPINILPDISGREQCQQLRCNTCSVLIQVGTSLTVSLLKRQNKNSAVDYLEQRL